MLITVYVSKLTTYLLLLLVGGERNLILGISLTSDW